MGQDKIAILLNPAAGKGRAQRARAHLEKLLRQLKISFDLYLTQSAEDLKSLTREMAGRYRILVGAGGDSTFQIMANELMRLASRPVLGTIGLGSSNDIPKEFGMESLAKACQALKRVSAKTIDVGCLDQENTKLLYFLGQANIGLGVAVNQDVEILLHRIPWLGKRQSLAGLLAIMNAYKKKKIPFPLEVESADGKMKGEFVAVVFGNIRYWATGRLINPQALIDDGRLDACLIRPCSFGRLLRLARLARQGHHGGEEEISFLSSPAFTVRSERAFAIQADGEIPGGPATPLLFTEIRVHAIPSSLRIIYGVGPR